MCPHCFVSPSVYIALGNYFLIMGLCLTSHNTSCLLFNFTLHYTCFFFYPIDTNTGGKFVSMANSWWVSMSKDTHSLVRVSLITFLTMRSDYNKINQLPPIGFKLTFTITPWKKFYPIFLPIIFSFKDLVGMAFSTALNFVISLKLVYVPISLVNISSWLPRTQSTTIPFVLESASQRKIFPLLNPYSLLRATRIINSSLPKFLDIFPSCIET